MPDGTTGGYIMAPGTSTTTGTYTVVGAVKEPAPLPTWLAAELLRTNHADQPATPAAPGPPPRALQAVNSAAGRKRMPGLLNTMLDDVTACAASPEGMGFSEKLNRAAFTAGGLISSGHLTEADAEDLLRTAAEAARPGQDRRSESIIRSALAAGARRPLHPRGRA